MSEESKQIKTVYDPKQTMSYGAYRCRCCGAGWYPGGEALHTSFCKVGGHDPDYVVYRYGSKESWRHGPERND